MQTLLGNGIEGTDYKVDAGKATKTVGSQGSGDVVGFKWDTPNSGIAITKPLIDQKIDKMFVDNKKIGVVDFGASLMSDTNTQKGIDLKKAVTDAETKYAFGELDEKGWNDAVDKWRKNGGDKIIEEFTADYNKSKAK
jgi:putative aldouronate transport system substrate-binding protein